MATETELERLVVRLTGDAQQYVDELKRAQQETVQAGQGIQQIAQNMGTAFQTVAAGIAAIGFSAAAHSALGAWQEEESAVLKLNATLKANGRIVEETMADYQAFASEMQRTTTLADEVVVGFLRQVETFGLTGDAAKKVTQDAIALAGAVDGTAQSAASYVRMAAAVAKGDIELAMHMARMVPQLRGVTDEMEFMAKFNQLTAAGLATVAAEAQSSAGQMKQLENAWSDFKEGIGKVIAEALVPVIEKAREVIQWLQDLPDPMKAGIAAFLGLGAATASVLVAAGSAILVYNNLIASVLRYVTVANAAKLGTIALQGAVIALAAYGIYQLVAAIFDVNGAIDAHNQRLEKMRELGAAISAENAKRGREMLEMAPAAGPERKSFLEDRLKKEQQVVANYKEGLKALQKDLADIGFDPFGKKAEPIKEAMKGMSDGLKAAQNNVKMLDAELLKFKAPEASKELLKAVRELTDGLNLQVKTFGMTAAQASLYKLQLQGATPAMLANAQASAAMLEQLEADKKVKEEATAKTKELEDSIKNQTESLQVSIDMFGRSADEIAIYKLSLLGANQAQLAQLQALAATKKAMEDRQKIMEEGKRTTEQFRTPIQVFNDQMVEYQKQLNAGAITQGVFNLVMDDAQKKFVEAELAARKAKQEIQGFDAALAGSAEAAQRIQSYTTALAGARDAARVRGQAESARLAFAAQPQPALAAGARGGDFGRLLERIARASEVTANKKTDVTLERVRLP